MRKGFLGALTAWLLWGSLGAAQSPPLTAPWPMPPSQNVLSQEGVVMAAPASACATPSPPVMGREMPSAEWVADPPSPPLDGLVWSASRLYGRAEYLLGWIKDTRVPPLATFGSLSDNLPGGLNQPSTTILFGGGINNEDHSGGRFLLGWWLDDQQHLSVEGSFFFLGGRTVSFVAGPEVPANGVLAVPFVNLSPSAVGTDFGMETAKVVSAPDDTANPVLGTIMASLTSQLLGAEANAVACLTRTPCYEVNLLAGFRFLDLEERLDLDTATTFLTNGGTLTTKDSFQTANYLYAGQIGTRAEFRARGFFMELTGTAALGSARQSITITGGSFSSAGQPPQSFPGLGVFAQPSNEGTFHRDLFAVVPEAGVNLGYNFSDYLKAFVGYTFLYWDNVVRPGDQIDRAINFDQPAGPPRPLVPFIGANFWVQEVNFGLQVVW